MNYGSEKEKVHLQIILSIILGREDLFLFLVSHGARHGWSRLTLVSRYSSNGKTK